MHARALANGAEVPEVVGSNPCGAGGPALGRGSASFKGT